MNFKSVILAAAVSCSIFPLQGAEIPILSGVKIAFLGDSITELGVKNPLGYVHLVMDGLSRAGVDASLIPAGVSGNTSDHMIKRLRKDVLSQKPQWMFLSCGVNDAPNGMDNPGVPLERYKKNISAILDEAKKAEIQVIVLTATPVLEEPEHVANKNLTPYNEFLRDAAKERNLLLVDLNKTFNALIDKKTDKSKRYLTIDGTHMNPRGNMLIAAAILRRLNVPAPVLRQCIEDWITRKNTWIIPVKLKLSVAEMEKLERHLHGNMTPGEWVNALVSEHLDSAD